MRLMRSARALATGCWRAVSLVRADQSSGCSLRAMGVRRAHAQLVARADHRLRCANDICCLHTSCLFSRTTTAAAATTTAMRRSRKQCCCCCCCCKKADDNFPFNFKWQQLRARVQAEASNMGELCWFGSRLFCLLNLALLRKAAPAHN